MPVGWLRLSNVPKLVIAGIYQIELFRTRLHIPGMGNNVAIVNRVMVHLVQYVAGFPICVMLQTVC